MNVKGVRNLKEELYSELSFAKFNKSLEKKLMSCLKSITAVMTLDFSRVFSSYLADHQDHHCSFSPGWVQRTQEGMVSKN